VPPGPLEPDTPLRALIVEDNPVNQRVAALMLDRLGHHTDVVDDGEQAVEAMKYGAGSAGGNTERVLG